MRVLVVATGSFGDIYPMIGLSREMSHRGHEVVFVTNEHFRGAVEAESLRFVAGGSDGQYMDLVNDPRLWHPRRSLELLFDAILEHTPAGYELLLQHLGDPGDAVLVASSISLPARIIRETHEVPLVTVHLAPTVLRSLSDPIHFPGLSIPAATPRWLKRLVWGSLDRFLLEPLILGKLNGFRAALGLSPIRRAFDQWLHSPDCVIGMFPDWFAPLKSDWPPNVHLTGFPLYDAAEHEPMSAEAEEFLSAGSPPVLVAPSTANVAGNGYFATSLAACARAGLRSLLVTRFSQQVPRPLPKWSAHFQYLPFSQVLPRCAAFVHHGGIGSLSQGFRAGVPQLIRPMVFDQFDNAWRAKQLSVARVVGAKSYRPSTVASALTDLISTRHSESRRKVASRFDGDDPLGRAADVVEAMLPSRH